MKPEILASLLGTLIGAIASIVVAWIQSKSKKSEDSPVILVPKEYKTHRPQASRIWFIFLPLVLLGGMIGYFSSTWFHSELQPQVTPIISETPGITPQIIPSATSTKDFQPILLFKNCINGTIWSSLDNKNIEQNNNCLSLDRWGIFAQDNGLTISLTNNSTESIRQGLFIPIE